MTDAENYCWVRGFFIFRSYHRYGHEASKKFPGLVSPQTELQEVLSTDREAGAPDGDEAAALGSSEEEKRQENIEPPVQTALPTASVPAAQVSSEGIPCAFATPACPCITCIQHAYIGRLQ